MSATSAVDDLIVVFEALPEDQREEAFEHSQKSRLQHLADDWPVSAATWALLRPQL